MKKQEKIGLFFGSFNPIHMGHLIIANYMLEFSDLTSVWFIVSPHNPLKEKTSLLADHHRLHMVRLAIEDNFRMKASDIEFRLPKPSFTVVTLAHLYEKYPGKDFVLIAGSDALPTLHKWKNFEFLLENYHFYIYNRPNINAGDYLDHSSMSFFNAPLMAISSSFIRESIKEGKDMRYFLPEKVYRYILEMHFYKK